MWTSALFGAEHIEFFEIDGVVGQTRWLRASTDKWGEEFFAI